jgi:hypothetical protein
MDKTESELTEYKKRGRKPIVMEIVYDMPDELQNIMTVPSPSRPLPPIRKPK